MEHQIKEIPFYNDTLLGIKDNEGKVWLAIKKTCKNIGLTDGQSQRQVANIRQDIAFKSNWCKFAPVQTEGDRKVKREIIALHEKFVPLWLAKINLTPSMQRKNPEAVKKLLKYQLEAQEVLHNYFMGTDAKKDSFYKELGLKGKIELLTQTIESQSKKIDSLLDYTTINYKQQQTLLKLARQRISDLLGGVHSSEYKENSRVYFKNIWNNLCNAFGCSSYKDLNPVHLDQAKVFLNNWIYVSY